MQAGGAQERVNWTITKAPGAASACQSLLHVFTQLYIGHASRARITSISSAHRPPIHTINHSREEGNGSLRYVNDIVHSVFYKLRELSQCCVQHPLTFEVHDPRERTKLLNRSVYPWASEVSQQTAFSEFRAW